MIYQDGTLKVDPEHVVKNGVLCCTNRLPCGICVIMKTVCPLNVNPYEVTVVNYGKEAENEKK